MATLSYLVGQGQLIRFETQLDTNDRRVRDVYLTLEVAAWLDRFLLYQPKNQGAPITSYEQVDQLLYEFIVGRPMAYGSRYHPLDPIGSSVWQLKTRDVRLIGWFPKKSVFLVVCGRLKTELLKFNLYKPCVNQCILYRSQIDLDPPKFVTGVSKNDVL